ncbi:MAG: XRE family transcriptional regulator [Candidatus Melainabacteria bacterium]|nr:XRE family transcriptional regulator [Candidatus Melainabacteria bacterium]
MKNVNRIKSIRDQVGLSQEELGKRINVTRQTLAAWESEERAPTIAQLGLIARALGIPLTVLLNEDEVGADSTMLFRADDPEELTPVLRSILAKRASDYASVERLTHEQGVVPESRPMAEYHEGHFVEQTAMHVRSWLGVGETTPLGDVLSLLEDQGFKVICYPLGTKMAGFSAYTDKWGALIVVNDSESTERKCFTALHELGHLIFHRLDYSQPQASKGRNDPREKAANHFAGAVLLPEEVVKSELYAYRNRNWIPEPLLLDIKRRYWVSMRTILIRAQQVGCITREQMGKQLGSLNKKYGRDQEAEPLPKPQRLNRLERLVFSALVREDLTTSRAAEILSMPLPEVRNQLESWMEEELVEL